MAVAKPKRQSYRDWLLIRNQQQSARRDDGYLFFGAEAVTLVNAQNLVMPWVAAVVAGVLVGTTVLTPAHAQSGAPLPGSIGRPPQAVTSPSSEPMIVTPSISVDLTAGVKPPPGLENEEVDVSDLQVEGMTLYGRDAFPEIAPILGKTVTLRVLYQLANTITKRYADDGYVLSLAYVPDQSIGDGAFRIVVIEGQVDRVVVDGVTGALADTVARLARRIVTGRPARLPDLERALLLINDLPGVRATGVLRPSRTGSPETSELVVQVTHRPFSAGLSIDNRGTRYVGPLQGLFDITSASAAGYGESIRVIGLGSATLRRQRYLGVDVSLPIGSDGLRFDSSVSRSLSAPGNELTSFNVSSESTSIEAALAYPVIRSSSFSLTLSSGFRAVDSRSLIDSALNYEDRLRALRLAATFEENTWLDGVTRGALRYTQSLPIFNASAGADRTSRVNMTTDSSFASIEFGRLQPLGGGFDLWLQGEAQYAFTTLSSYDEYAIGGGRFGRAFEPGEVTGRQGWAGSAEIRYSFSDIVTGADRAQLYVFTDTGSVWNTTRRQTLSSGGAGIRVDTGIGIEGYVEFARVLGRPEGATVRTPDQRIWTGVRLQF